MTDILKKRGSGHRQSDTGRMWRKMKTVVYKTRRNLKRSQFLFLRNVRQYISGV
jgi:hypothetical protein